MQSPRLVVAFALASALACSSGSESQSLSPGQGLNYVVLAWNDLGMHCLNPSYDKAVILPPYNTIWAQVVKRGNPPQLVTAGISVQYRIEGNTYSYGKRSYGQFWDNAGALFGASSLLRDHGLNLVEPSISNGLSGAMVARGTHFAADGIPLVPVDDAGNWNPYQVAVVSVKDASGKVLVETRATVPTSDEIRCDKCHGADPFGDILAKHDAAEGTHLATSKPVLCASCHASPALGAPVQSGIPYLSKAIHGFHGLLASPPSCYDCHPGQQTQCSRSLAHATVDGNCTTCHGTLSQVASTIPGIRIPWQGEPRCATCHPGVAEVDTGTVLYRNASGHGGLSCPACHGSPHAMVPTRIATDAYQQVQYQGKAKSLGTCSVCHQTSAGGGRSATEFAEAHGGASPEHVTSCHACHTAVDSAPTRWPHQFQWKAR